jgi:hypothetical protein
VTPAVIWLGWACYAGAAVAIVVYLRHLLGRERWKRPWSAAGLLFTSLALGQTPFLFEDAYDRSRISRAFIVTVCLLVATGIQAFVLLRPRNADAGSTRAEPPSQGPAE